MIPCAVIRLLFMHLPSYIQRLTNLFLFLLPWQTIWIYKEAQINGVKWQYGTQGFYATEMLAWIIVLLFLCHYVSLIKKKEYIREKKTKWDRLFVGTGCLFFIYLFATSFVAPFPDVVEQYIVRMMLVFILFILFSTKVIDFSRATLWLIAGSIPAGILGIWQFLSQTTVASSFFGLASHPAAEAGTSIIAFEGERWLRAYGPMAHPNIFGGYLFLIVAVCFYYWFVAHTSRISFRFSRMYETVTLIAALLGSSALFFTFSRSAWIGVAILWVGTFFLFIKQRIGVRFHMVLLIPVIILSSIYVPLVTSRLGIASSHEQQSIDERVSGVVEAKSIIRDHLWLGTGAGNYTAAVYRLDKWRPGWEYQPVHSTPILLFAEIGVVGSTLLFLWIVSFFFLYKDVLLRARLFVFSVFIGISPLLFLDHYLYTSYLGLVLFALLISTSLRPLNT